MGDVQENAHTIAIAWALFIFPDSGKTQMALVFRIGW